MKFLVKLGNGSGNILKKLCMVYGDGALKATAVYNWVGHYEEGRELPRSGRPISTQNDENLKCVDKLHTTNRRISNCYTAETLGINRETIRLIIVEELRMQKLRSRIIPKSLKAEQKHQLDVAADWFKQCITDPNFLDRMITGDELWFFEYNPSDQ